MCKALGKLDKWCRGILMLFLLTIPAIAGADKGYYKLGAGDIINVSIFGGGEQQVSVDLTVSEQGQVNFPFLGNYQAGGLTSKEFESAVYTPLAQDYFVDPQVHIRVKEYHSLSFSITGSVKKPGNYEGRGATTLLDLIAKAGGVTKDRSNIAYILKDENNSKDQSVAQKEPRKVNLAKLLDAGDMSQNFLLQSADSVYIPSTKHLNQSESKIYVSGEVKNPALYEFQPGLTALHACIQAGGFGKYAAPNRATIIRIEDGSQIVMRVNLDDIIEGKAEDIALEPGDRINVPESWF